VYLSESALLTGIEWNYRAVAKAAAAAFQGIQTAFDSLFSVVRKGTPGHREIRESAPDPGFHVSPVEPSVPAAERRHRDRADAEPPDLPHECLD
jgi:hypothetical protein